MSELASFFKELHSCEVITPRTYGYDAKRRIFNGFIEKRPSLIVYPETENSLISAFNICRERGNKFSIRAGGHNVAGTSIVEDGVVIDTSRMHRVKVDRKNKTAEIEPGAFWRDVDTIAAKFDLCTPGGIISDTGVAGLTLGGGIGWLNGLYGLACDNLIEAEVLLADGRVVKASSSENSDLLWALKGGGGNFGLVTKFVMKLHDLPNIFAGSIVYPYSEIETAINRYVTTCLNASDKLTTSFVATTRSDKKIVSLDVCYAGDSLSGLYETDSLISLNSNILEDTRKTRSYINWQREFDEDIRRGLRSYWRSVFISNPLDPKFISTLNRYFSECPSEYTMLTFDHIHGASTRVGRFETAYSHRNKNFLFLINTNWEDSDDDNVNIDWCNRFYNDLISNFGAENYVNYLSNEEDERIKLAYGVQTYEKLKVIKRKFDPKNLFSANQNIKA